MIICSLVAFPLAISMITVGALSIDTCSKEADLTNTNSSTVLSDSTSNQTTGNFDIPYTLQYKPRLLFFTPFFSAVYYQKWLLLQKICVLNKEIWI